MLEFSLGYLHSPSFTNYHKSPKFSLLWILMLWAWKLFTNYANKTGFWSVRECNFYTVRFSIYSIFLYLRTAWVYILHKYNNSRFQKLLIWLSVYICDYSTSSTDCNISTSTFTYLSILSPTFNSTTEGEHLDPVICVKWRNYLDLEPSNQYDERTFSVIIVLMGLLEINSKKGKMCLSPP